MAPPTSLALFGVPFTGDVDELARELRERAGDTDAILLDAHQDVEDWPRHTLRVALRIPLVWLGAALLDVLRMGLLLLFTRDLVAPTVALERRLEGDDGPPVHRVGPTHGTPADHGPVAVVATWTVGLTLAWLAPVGLLALGVLAAVGDVLPAAVYRSGRRRLAVWTFGAGLAVSLWLLWAGIAPPWLLGTVTLVAVGYALLRRWWTGRDADDSLLDRVDEHAADHGYETAVLVVGEGDVDEVAAAASGRGLQVPWIHARDGDAFVTREGPVEPESPAGVASADADAIGLPGVVPGSERSLGRRVGAALADVPLAAIVALLSMFVVVLLEGALLAPVGGVPGYDLVGPAIVVAGSMGYYLFAERRYGTTPGKHAFGLAVGDAGGGADDGGDADHAGRDAEDASVPDDVTGGGAPGDRGIRDRSPGGPIDRRQAVVRNLLRPVDALVGWLLVLATGRRQRLGDLAAGTVVGTIDRSGRDGAESTGGGGADPLALARSVEARDGSEHPWRTHPAVEPASEPVGDGRRVVAAGLDLLPATAAVCGGITAVIFLLVPVDALGVDTVGYAHVVAAVAGPVLPCAIAYHALLEYRYGTTIGKWNRGLVVASEDGGQPTGRQVLVRNLLRPVDVLGGGLLVLATRRHQRLGDLAAGTEIRPAAPPAGDGVRTRDAAGRDERLSPAERGAGPASATERGAGGGS